MLSPQTEQLCVLLSAWYSDPGGEPAHFVHPVATPMSSVHIILATRILLQSCRWAHFL